MKLSQKYWLIAAALFTVSIAMSVPWAVICLANEGRLLANGPWVLIILSMSGVLVAVLRAWRHEREEDREAAEREASDV